MSRQLQITIYNSERIYRNQVDRREGCIRVRNLRFVDRNIAVAGSAAGRLATVGGSSLLRGCRIHIYTYIYSNPSRQYTSAIAPASYIFTRARESDARTRQSLRLPAIRLASAISHYIHTGRRAADILAAGNPYKETHLRRGTSDFGGACEGHAVQMSRRRGRQMLDRATPYSERNECRRTLGPLAARWLSFDCFLKNAIGKLK